MNPLIEQIQAAYERDQLRKDEKVYAASELPLSYEAITAEWLTDILCSKHPGAAVTAHRLGEPDSGSSNRRKIVIDYNQAGRDAGLPAALFCKATHGLANRMTLGLAGAAQTEVTFYNEIRPLLDIEAPVSYFARLDTHSFNSIVVLKDLSGGGTEFCSHKTVMTRARVESQMALLARLHGKAYADASVRAKLPLFFTWSEFFNNTLAFGMREGSEGGFQSGQEVIPPRLFKRHAEIWPATVASVQRHDQLPPTLMHGDVHLKNWYVVGVGAGSGEMGLGDWQVATRGHWGRDFAYTISTALTVEDRRAWDKELLRFYLDRLHAAGGPKVSFEEAWTHYRQQLMTALTWWTITLNPAPGMPDMQPRDITLEFIRRISTAMDDVDSLDSFT